MALKYSDDYYYNIVRKNIRKYRKEKGYTLQKLAEEAEMSMDYLAEIESEKRKKSFSLAILGRIAEVLDVDIVKFFDKNNWFLYWSNFSKKVSLILSLTF